jgi:lauroyl/myristoyl acyltransferase
VQASRLVVDAPPAEGLSEPDRHLGALLAVGRSARRHEFIIAHLGSGTFLRTDGLGARIARALTNGYSDSEAARLAEQLEPGAGERARRLTKALDDWDALNADDLARSDLMRLLRRLLAKALGQILTVVGRLIPLAPTWMLVRIFRIWLSTPIAYHVWRCSQFRIRLNLTATGYASMPEAQLEDLGRRCAAEPSRNFLFHYAAIALPPKRLTALVDRLFEKHSVKELAARLEDDGPAVAVFLHCPLCAAVPTALRSRGNKIVRVVVPRTHGVMLSRRSGLLVDFFGESPDMAVDEGDPDASGELLRHLKAGRSVYIALDKLAIDGRAPRIEMLGHKLARNDGPAWLAVRSGRPVSLLTTHDSPTGVVIKASQFLYPDASVPMHLRVERLSQHLYAQAERAIRQHPEAWTCWADLSLLQADS